MQVYPHGSTDTLPFATMGSGSLAAMAVFESKYREGLTVSKMIHHMPYILSIYFMIIKCLKKKSSSMISIRIVNKFDTCDGCKAWRATAISMTAGLHLPIYPCLELFFRSLLLLHSNFQ